MEKEKEEAGIKGEEFSSMRLFEDGGQRRRFMSLDKGL